MIQKDCEPRIDFWKFEEELTGLLSEDLRGYCNCDKKEFLYNIFHDLRKKVFKEEGESGHVELLKKYDIHMSVPLDVKIAIS